MGLLRFNRCLHQRSSRALGKLGQFHRSPIVLQLVTPDVQKPELHEFSNPEGLVQLVQSFNGTLRATKSDPVKKIISPNQYKGLDPANVYEIVSPMFGAAAAERRLSQVSDKAFEDKCRLAFIRFLDAGNLEYSELSRIVKNGDCIVAEWEAIFEVQGGEVYLLECKHFVTADILAKQNERKRKTMSVLGKHPKKGTVFVAGEYWENGLQSLAHELGFGVLFENGDDITVATGAEM